MKAKFAVHPGIVYSKMDGDIHHIGVGALVRLYELRYGEYIVWNYKRRYNWDDYIHLFPNYQGNYGRPQ